MTSILSSSQNYGSIDGPTVKTLYVVVYNGSLEEQNFIWLEALGTSEQEQAKVLWLDGQHEQCHRYHRGLKVLVTLSIFLMAALFAFQCITPSRTTAPGQQLRGSQNKCKESNDRSCRKEEGHRAHHFWSERKTTWHDFGRRIKRGFFGYDIPGDDGDPSFDSQVLVNRSSSSSMSTSNRPPLLAPSDPSSDKNPSRGEYAWKKCMQSNDPKCWEEEGERVGNFWKNRETDKDELYGNQKEGESPP